MEDQRESKYGLVSVIIPVYNCEKYLDICLSSVMAQTYKKLEVIVVNDGSIDDSLKIIQKYASDYANIMLINQKNFGVSAARNKGIEKASGEYLLFLDGDDYIRESYIKNLVAAAQNNASDLVICGYTMVNPEGKVIQEIIPGIYKKGEQEEWAYRLFSVCSHLYKRQIWVNSGIKFAEGARGEDIPVGLYFNYVCNNIVVIPEGGYYYVQHRDSAMGAARGLHNFPLPLEAIRAILDRMRDVKESNSHEFLEYGVLKAFAMFLFDLGRGAHWKLVRKLCRETEDMVRRYFPSYRQNAMFRWNSRINMPFAVKSAVWLLVKLLNLHMLYPFMWVYCRATRRLGGKKR